ncbi:MAG: fumarylacetoacetate hydrolase family protein [Pseudomonadota bacterium]
MTKFMASSGAVWAIEGDEAVNLTALDRNFGADLMGPISMGREDASRRAQALFETGQREPLGDLVPDMPVKKPGKVLCLGHNYVDHIKEGGYDIPEFPAIFVRVGTSLTAAGRPLIAPKASPRFDFEVELMIVIGTQGRNIAASDALDHIFGYTVFNDGTLRDFQKRSHQWTPGKNFDSTGPVGSVVVTADELGDAAGLTLRSRLNGEVMQDGTTDDMMWKVPQIIEVMSEFATLEPGDLIATGTPPGVGHARTPPVFMKAGDVIEVEVEGIGLCRNPVAAEGASDAD